MRSSCREHQVWQLACSIRRAGRRMFPRPGEWGAPGAWTEEPLVLTRSRHVPFAPARVRIAAANGRGRGILLRTKRCEIARPRRRGATILNPTTNFISSAEFA